MKEFGIVVATCQTRVSFGDLLEAFQVNGSAFVLDAMCTFFLVYDLTVSPDRLRIGNYGAPQGYCWDVNCEDTFITDLNQHQLEASMHKLLEMLRVQSDQTKGNHIMMTMGSDFQVATIRQARDGLFLVLYLTFILFAFSFSFSSNGLMSTLLILT